MEFISGLPTLARADLNRSQHLVASVHSAIGYGWTVEQLVRRCGGNFGGAVNIGAIVQHRLDGIDGPPPTERGSLKMHDGCCEGGWIYPDDGEPIKCSGRREVSA